MDGKIKISPGKDHPLHRISIPLTGFLLTSCSTLETGKNYRILRNMRYGISMHPQAVAGMTKINTTPLGAYTNVRGAINFAKNQPEVENHILIQAWNGGLTASQVY